MRNRNPLAEVFEQALGRDETMDESLALDERTRPLEEIFPSTVRAAATPKQWPNHARS